MTAEGEGEGILDELRRWKERADVASLDNGPLYVSHAELGELRRTVARNDDERRRVLGYEPPGNLHIGALAGFAGIPLVVDEERARARRRIEELRQRRAAELVEAMLDGLERPRRFTDLTGP